MSTRQQIPMTEIKENEELVTEHENEVQNKSNRKISKNSVGSSASEVSFVNPLMSAVRRGKSFHDSFFKKAKLDEMDIIETDSLQRNVFHYAVSKPDTLRQLLENAETETSIQAALRQRDEEGETPMHRAAVIANIESLEILHEYDNSLIKLKTTVKKLSVLHSAVKGRSVVAVKFVLSKEPDLENAVDNMMQSPLHYAACLKQSNVLECLIAKGSDTTIMDTNDQLPLHIAASKGLKNNVTLLLRENPDFINVVDKSYRSSLILAAQNNFPTTVAYLLSKNADYTIQDKVGLTAFDWAISSDFADVAQAFLDIKFWKEVVSGSHHGPEGCLVLMIETMPEMAKKLLDKCVTTEGSKESRDYQVIYDFFCLEEIGKNGCPYPQFEALKAMVEHESEICLGHPVSIKYVNLKWKKRGFKYSLIALMLTLIFHICLMAYAILVVGNVTGANNSKKLTRVSTSPDAPVTMVLRIILLVITFAAIVKDIFQMKMQRFRYFTKPSHYLEMAMHIMVILFLLPVNKTLTTTHIGAGAFAVLYSWMTLIQYLKVVPIMGIYIIVVQTIFRTLMKVLLVVVIYLLSFSSTFYILLTDHGSFGNMLISLISTFVTMTSGLDNYSDHFVKHGWKSETHEIKLMILVLFILIMMIVVNNALIGLAVGDTDEVMKSAKFDKFKQRAEFIIHLEKTVNKISWLRVKEDKSVIVFPQQKKNFHKKVLDLLYFGSKMDTVDGGNEIDKDEQEMEITLEDQIEKAIEIKFENLRSSLRYDLKGIQDENKEGNKGLEEKIEVILEKLNEMKNNTKV